MNEAGRFFALYMQHQCPVLWWWPKKQKGGVIMELKKVSAIAGLLLLFNFASTAKGEVKNPEIFPVTRTEFALTVKTIPQDATVRIMNIRPRYQDGILLKPGKYDPEVSLQGYETYQGSITLGKKDKAVVVRLSRSEAQPFTNSLVLVAIGKDIAEAEGHD